MTKEQLYDELSYVNHSREKRLHYANMLLNNAELVPKVLDILFMVNDKTSCRAAWIFEFMCTENINAIIPHLDSFTKGITEVHYDSAVRPVAKICEFLAKAYYLDKNKNIIHALTPIYKERLIEVCFDYLITDQKVAPKAYAMNALFLFGQDYDWIHPELKQILQREYHLHSAAFKARAKHILKKINSY